MMNSGTSDVDVSRICKKKLDARLCSHPKIISHAHGSGGAYSTYACG